MIPEELSQWIKANALDVCGVLGWLRTNPRMWALMVETAKLDDTADRLRADD